MANNLHNQYRAGYGKSRKAIKDEHNRSPLIHSADTYATYTRQCDYFADWCMAHGYRYVDEHIDTMIADYCEELIAKGKSPYTARTALNAICHALNKRTTEIPCKLPERRRENITRSRKPVEYDKHINLDHHKDLVRFQLCFGLRKGKELAPVKVSDIRDDGRNLTLHTIGKGGKHRTFQACGSSEDIAAVRAYIASRPADGLLFDRVPKAFDGHAERAAFASRLYHEHARPLDTLSREELYICRGDKRGEKYDRQALQVVSRALGHSRLSVVINNYSWRF